MGVESKCVMKKMANLSVGKSCDNYRSINNQHALPRAVSIV